MGNSTSSNKAAAANLKKNGILAEHLVGMLEMIKKINQATTLSHATSLVVEEACKMMGCDRATVFVVDKINEQLVIKHSSNDDALDIRIPWNTGLSGHVYQSGETLNIPDAYKDDRFNQDTDAKTGYKTTSMMCCPIKDQDGSTVAVLQVINKKGKGSAPVPFVERDAIILSHLQTQLGAILRTYMTLEMEQVTQGRIHALLDIVKSVNSGMGMPSLTFTLTNRTPALVDADRCTLFLVDRQREELYSLQGAVEIRIPMTSGLAGHVGRTGEVLNIRDAYNDPRFNQDYDKKHNFRTKQILCCPIFASDNKTVLAVIQLINKNRGEKFTTQDVELLNVFLSIAGGIMEQSQVFTRQKRRLTEFERMVTVKKGTGQDAKVAMAGTILEEVDEEEEEDDD
jgi:adenylate cyclase